MRIVELPLYENREDVTLTAYLPDDSPEMLAGKPRPGIVICPGGGYFTCSDREGEPVALKFVSMGYHAFVLRYSVYGESPLFDDAPPVAREHSRFPHAIQEVGQSFLMIRERALEWHVDPDRLAVCGFSAGGHVAALYATRWDSDLIGGHFGKPPELFRPIAAVLGYPLTDYVYKQAVEKNRPAMEQKFFQASNIAFLGEAFPPEEVLEAVSPVLHVSAQTPPTFLWATAQDDLVPVQHSIRMANALADHGIPFELHIFEEGPHGLGLADAASAESKSQIFPDVAKWADLAGCWLGKRLSIDLPEKSAFEKMMERSRR